MINTSDITNQSSKDSEKINLSSSIQEQKPFETSPNSELEQSHYELC